MHKVATARPVPAAFGVFWTNLKGRLVPCEAYTIAADGRTTSDDCAGSDVLADAFERGETFLTYEAYTARDAAEQFAQAYGINYSVRPLPAGWFFYDGETLCVVAATEPAAIEPATPARSLTVPERNRAIKKLLETTYGKGCASVRAGNGTAYRWVEIKFLKMPDALRGLRYADLKGALDALISGAGIELSTYNDDMGGGSTCISITTPRAEAA